MSNHGGDFPQDQSCDSVQVKSEQINTDPLVVQQQFFDRFWLSLLAEARRALAEMGE
jgi:hypothetical protein